MRRSSNPTRKISITIPDRIFQELDRSLSYTQSRSRFISTAIEEKLHGSEGFTVGESTTKQLMAALLQRDDIDLTLKALLLHILSK
jgi:metal-responsive CopG/Arc/MetJ family transcriptional regulator